MAKKCLYCATELNDNSVIDFCERCGKGVWGEKMFNDIVKNMETARENGDLCHTEPIQSQAEAIQDKIEPIQNQPEFQETPRDFGENRFY